MKNSTTNRQARRQKATAPIERLGKFLEFKGETFTELTKALQLSQNYFAASKRGEGAIGIDGVILILEYYKEINPDWFLFGTGSMLRGGTVEEKAVLAKNARKSKLDKETDARVKQTKKLRDLFAKMLAETEQSLREYSELQVKP